MAGLVPAIPRLNGLRYLEDADARDKRGHDAVRYFFAGGAAAGFSSAFAGLSGAVMAPDAC